MRQHKQNTDKNQTEVDAVIDELFSQQIKPSKDFTARVLEEATANKVTQGPWHKPSSWIGGVLTAAAAIAIAFGLSHVYSPKSAATDYSAESIPEASNPFLENFQDSELVEESPINAIDNLLDHEEGLPSIDPLLDEPLLIDLNILLES